MTIMIDLKYRKGNLSEGNQTGGVNMKYFEDAFRFVTKNYLIIIPIFIATLVPALLIIGNAPSPADIQAIFNDFAAYPDYFMSNPGAFFDALQQAGAGSSASSGTISTILNIMAIPMTAGLIKMGLSSGNVSINDFAPALSANIGKYLRFFLAIIVFFIVGVIAVVLIFIALVSVMFLSESGWVIFFLGVVLLSFGALALSVFLSFWFYAMVLDDLKVMEAFKKSFAVAKRCFWTLIGISILIALIQGLAGIVIGWFAVIPVLPTVLTSAVSAFASVVHTVFLFKIYRSFQPAARAEFEEVNVIY